MALSKIKNLHARPVFRWLLEILILAVLLWLFFILAGRALCHIAIAQIAELTNTKIKTGSVSFDTDGSVLIKNLTVSPYKQRSDGSTILKARTVYARFSLASLFLLRPRLKLIDVNDFVFNAQYDLDLERWNLSALTIKPPKGTAGKMPRIDLGAGTLQYSKIKNGQVAVALSVPLNARFGLDRETQKGYGFEITTTKLLSGHGQSRLTGFWKPGSVAIAGGIASVDIPELEMAWIIEVLAAELKYDRDDNFTLKLRIDDLHSKRSPALDKLAKAGPAFLDRSGPFAALQRFFSRYQPYGQADIDLDASGNFNRLSESSLSGKLYCKDVTFCYCDFPYTVEQLSGTIDFTKNSVAFDNLKGKHGEVELRFDGSSRDFGPDWQYRIHISSDNMALDNDLYSVLNAKQKESWLDFLPAGFAAIDYRFARSSKSQMQEILTVEPLGAEARYRRFPYPLKNLTGRIIFQQDNVVFSNLVSRVTERKIAVNGRVTFGPADSSEYDISVEVNNIPLDSTLEQSLPKQQRTLYTQLSPAGTADGLIEISARNDDPASFTAHLSFKDASLESDRFSLPVSDITANAVFTPELIDVNSFVGKYGDGAVSLTGRIWPAQDITQSRYKMSLRFDRVQFNDELFGSVPQSMKETVADMKPQGTLNLSVDLNKDTCTGPPVYTINMDCLGMAINIPDSPVDLKNIVGTMSVADDGLTVRNMTATLNSEVSGAQEPSENANKSSSSAGASLSDVFSRLAPAGRVNLDFMNVRIMPAEDGHKSIDFTGNIRFDNCSFKVTRADAELDAALAIRGLYDTRDGLRSCRADLNAGRFMIQGKSFTSLKTHILYVPDLRRWLTEDLIADCCGGRAVGKLELKQPDEEPAQYLLQMILENVDLRRFLADKEDIEITSGTMDGLLSMSARFADSSSRLGLCRLTIRNMRAGQLSPVGKLVQVLQLNEPKDFAFDQMFVDSYISGDQLIVKKLDLSGQTVAFYGSGLMDLKTRNVDLDLIARGRRLATDDPSVLQSLTEGLGSAVVKMEVTGDLYDPDVRSKTLPLIRDTLKILGTRPETN
jgi:hypothetical protein